MKIIPHIQGSELWLKARSLSDGTASELSAAAGVSKHMSRSELLNQKITGITKENNLFTQALFAKGHLAEDSARKIAEEIIEEELYPITVIKEFDGLNLLASLDGSNMTNEIIFEHKLYNKKLADDVLNGCLDEHYTLQMDQQLLVSGAEKCLFMCSDGTKENMAWCWYRPEQDKLDAVVSVWSQFRKDLAEYEHVQVVELPKAEAILELPAVIVQVKGELTLCNIGDMRPVFDKFLSEATVNLVTDNDFAQAEAESKIGRDAAKRCLATAKGVIDQTASISEVTRELEQYAAKFNALALSQEKAVKTQKEARKLAIMNLAKGAFVDHITKLESEIKPIRLVAGQPNFPEAMKNKRLLSAIQDGVDAELARVKIEADSIARMIRVNLNLMTDNAPYQFLFNDLSQIIYKPFDDLKLLISSRITEHEKRESEKLEAERLRIQAEEEAKAQRKAEAEQAEKMEAERAKVRAEEQARIAEERRLERIEFDRRQEAERLAAQEYLAPNGPTANLNTPWAEEPRVIESVNKATGKQKPTRFQMIDSVALKFNVSSSLAEQWLTEEFNRETEHA